MYCKKIRALLGLAALLPGLASAVPITIDFTITATRPQDSQGDPATTYNGYSPGAQGSGSATFDDSIGNFFENVDGLVPIDLTFSWLGRTWDESNARFSYLEFDATGQLKNWFIGAWIPGYDCDLSCVSTEGPTDFWLGEFNGGLGVLHDANAPGQMFGSVTWIAHPAASVPEPASTCLMLIGMLGLVG